MVQGSPSSVAVRCFLPEAKHVDLLLSGRGQQPVPMKRVHQAGLFEAIIPGPLGTSPYQLRVTNYAGQVSERHDPYSFSPLLTDFELHLFAEGTLFKAYDTLGALTRKLNGVGGVRFGLLATNAMRP